MRWLRASAAVVCIGAVTAGIAAQTKLDRAAVRRAVAARDARIQSIHVAFSYPESGGQGHYVHAELSFLGNRVMVVDSGHGWTQQSWREFYGRSRSYVRGDTYEVDWPNKLAYEVRPLVKGERLQRFEVEGWIRASGYWPPEAPLPDPEFFGSNLNLRTVVADDRYRFRVEATGQPKRLWVILERPGHDRITLDPDCGLALRKRVWFLKGQRAMEVDVEELTEVGEQVFLPKTYRIRTYLEARGRPASRAVDLRTTVHVTEVNQLTAARVAFERRPGAIRFNRRDMNKTAQTEAGGVEFLVEEAEQQAAIYVQRYPSGSWRWTWILIGSLVLWAGAWGVSAWRVRSRGPMEVHDVGA